ncbi:unnamed protein product, partial [Mesorhabditis spiculigera]
MNGPQKRKAGSGYYDPKIAAVAVPRRSEAYIRKIPVDVDDYFPTRISRDLRKKIVPPKRKYSVRSLPHANELGEVSDSETEGSESSNTRSSDATQNTTISDMAMVEPGRKRCDFRDISLETPKGRNGVDAKRHSYRRSRELIVLGPSPTSSVSREVHFHEALTQLEEQEERSNSPVEPPPELECEPPIEKTIVEARLRVIPEMPRYSFAKSSPFFEADAMTPEAAVSSAAGDYGVRKTVLMANLTREQLDRYDACTTANFSSDMMQDIIQKHCDIMIGPSIAEVIGAVAKTFLGELVEEAMRARHEHIKS